MNRHPPGAAVSCSGRNVTQVVILLCLLRLIAAPPLAAEDNTGAGILHMRSQSPLQSLRMVIPSVAAGSVTPGWGTFLLATWSNIWAEEESYYLDYELLDIRMTVGYGLNDRLALALAYDHRSYFGGQMDSFIQGFHDALSIHQNGRDQASKGQSRIGRIGLTVEENSADTFNNSGATLLLSYELTRSNGLLPAVNLSTSVRYGFETAGGFTDDHPIDYGFSLGLGKRLTPKWYLHLIGSYSHYDQTRLNDLWPGTYVVLENHQFNGLIACGYDYSERLTLLIQYMQCESAVENIKGLDETSHEVHLGLKYRTVTLGQIEFGIIENAISFDNSRDFGLHFGWGYFF